MMPDELVPLAEGARRLGLAQDTARTLLSAGRLRGEKHQGRWCRRVTGGAVDLS